MASLPFDLTPGLRGEHHLAVLLMAARRARATGVLRLESPAGTSRLFLKDGAPVSARMGWGFKPLPQILVEHGLVDIEALDRALPRVTQGRDWPAALRELELVSDQTLAQGMRLQLRDHLQSLAQAGKLRFELQEEEVAESPGRLSPVEAIAAALEGPSARAVVLEMLESLGPRLLRVRAEAREALEGLELSPAEAGVLSASAEPTAPEDWSAKGVDRARAQWLAALLLGLGLAEPVDPLEMARERAEALVQARLEEARREAQARAAALPEAKRAELEAERRRQEELERWLSQEQARRREQQERAEAARQALAEEQRRLEARERELAQQRLQARAQADELLAQALAQAEAAAREAVARAEAEAEARAEEELAAARRRTEELRRALEREKALSGLVPDATSEPLSLRPSEETDRASEGPRFEPPIADPLLSPDGDHAPDVIVAEVPAKAVMEAIAAVDVSTELEWDEAPGPALATGAEVPLGEPELPPPGEPDIEKIPEYEDFAAQPEPAGAPDLLVEDEPLVPVEPAPLESAPLEPALGEPEPWAEPEPDAAGEVSAEHLEPEADIDIPPGAEAEHAAELESGFQVELEQGAAPEGAAGAPILADEEPWSDLEPELPAEAGALDDLTLAGSTGEAALEWTAQGEGALEAPEAVQTEEVPAPVVESGATPEGFADSGDLDEALVSAAAQLGSESESGALSEIEATQPAEGLQSAEDLPAEAPVAEGDVQAEEAFAPPAAPETEAPALDVAVAFEELTEEGFTEAAALVEPAMVPAEGTPFEPGAEATEAHPDASVAPVQEPIAEAAGEPELDWGSAVLFAEGPVELEEPVEAAPTPSLEGPDAPVEGVDASVPLHGPEDDSTVAAEGFSQGDLEPSEEGASAPSSDLAPPVDQAGEGQVESAASDPADIPDDGWAIFDEPAAAPECGDLDPLSRAGPPPSSGLAERVDRELAAEQAGDLQPDGAGDADDELILEAEELPGRSPFASLGSREPATDASPGPEPRREEGAPPPAEHGQDSTGGSSAGTEPGSEAAQEPAAIATGPTLLEALAGAPGEAAESNAKAQDSLDISEEETGSSPASDAVVGSGQPAAPAAAAANLDPNAYLERTSALTEAVALPLEDIDLELFKRESPAQTPPPFPSPAAARQAVEPKRGPSLLDFAFEAGESARRRQLETPAPGERQESASAAGEPRTPPNPGPEAASLQERRRRYLGRAFSELGIKRPGASQDPGNAQADAQAGAPAAPAAKAPAASEAPARSPEESALASAIEAKAAAVADEDYFARLGLARGATREEVKQAFVSLAKKFHPDRLPPSLGDLRPKAEAVFQALCEASDTLQDEAQRQAYLEKLDAREDPSDEIEQQAVLGDQALRRREYARAAECFERAWELSKRPVFLARRAWAIYLDPAQRERQAEVKAMLEDAWKLDPACDSAAYSLGIIARVEGDMDRAEKYFRAAIAANAHHAEAKTELRLIEMRRRKQAK